MSRSPRTPPAPSTPPSVHAWTLAGLGCIAALAWWPALANGFVNWDDPTVIVQNPRLTAPHVAEWALGTTLIGHFQPLSWLTWSGLARAFGLSPLTFHAASVLGHLVNATLVYAVAWCLIPEDRFSAQARRVAAATAAIVFAVHPVRVEAVAWASAFPYVLSTAMLLGSFLLYLNRRVALAIAAFTLALLVRPIALAFPLVLLAVDVYPLRRRIDRRVLFEKLPFAVLAVAAGIAELRAREMASVQEVGVGARLTMAVTAPFLYLARTVFPVGLTPLDPLPIAPTVDAARLGLGTAGLAAVVMLVWGFRRRTPALAIGAIAYVLLLAPVVGLTPSGLQATADRYVYLPGVVVSVLVGYALAWVWPRDRMAAAASLCAAAGLVGALSVLTWRQARWWHDSITLWTRAADLDPRNDIATYNLALALAEAGRDEEAIARFEQTLRLVPDQTLARDSLHALQASRSEREGDRLADSGNLEEAERAYMRALAVDARRPHARAARAIVLTRLGRWREAVPDLRAAYDATAPDTAVLNALAFALTEAGEFAEATAVLKRGVDLRPDDVNMTHNLARLLATAPDPNIRDGRDALRLALIVRDRTGGNDPRALDTLAAAYAATGQIDRARDTAAQAVSKARQLGDGDLAVEIANHARTYRKE